MIKNNSLSEKRLVVVLGGHRNGTSAITRALVALGVELGETLLPPVQGDNDKGYWEDSDINDLHHDLLDHLGVQWSDLQWPNETDLASETLGLFKLRALEMLRSKAADHPVFGLKNPRISRLLPFWQDVFGRLQREVCYVIAVRNPLSAQRSIAKGNLRGDIPSEKAHYLWLSHVVPSVCYTRGSRRVVVDYDRMLADPRGQISRISRALELKPLSVEAVEEYAGGFLQLDLRRNIFRSDDFSLSSELPAEAVEAFSLLERAADDMSSLDEDGFNDQFMRFMDRLEGLRPAFNLVGRLERKKADLQSDVAARAQVAHDALERVRELESEFATCVRQRDVVVEALAQRDVNISRAIEAVAERENAWLGACQKATDSLRHELADAKEQLVNTEEQLVNAKEQLSNAEVQLSESAACLERRDSDLALARTSMSELEAAIQDLTYRHAEAEGQVVQLQASLAEGQDAVAASESRIATLEASLSDSLESLARCEASLADAESRGRSAERRIEMLVAELGDAREKLQRVTLEVEVLRVDAATVGAKIGRRLTRFRSRWMPMDSVAGRWVTRMNNLMVVVAREGLWAGLRKALRKVGIAPAVAMTEASPENVVVNGAASELGGAAADHPQLSAWISAHEPDASALDAQAEVAMGFAHRPLISVILPIYRVPREVLEETLACLSAQTYGNWEACLAWSDTSDLDGWRWLQARVVDDPRFKLLLLDENGGISRNSNRALEIATGDFAALLDHDDTLAPWAFFEVVSMLQSQPDLDFIYSDKDSIRADGKMRLNALFKPGWSPEMLHSVNYLTHLNVMRTDILCQIGGWVPETDGAQDWDIFFRVTERTSRIARIPSILYHWRILPTSTATGMQAKPYAAMGQLRAQQAYFSRKSLPAQVTSTPEGLFHVGWPVAPAVAQVIVRQTGTVEQVVTVLDMLRAGTQHSIGGIHVSCRSLDGQDASRLTPFSGVWGERFRVIAPSQAWTNILQDPGADDMSIVVVLDGRAAGLSRELIDELVGWLTFHPEIAWVSGIALNPDGTVYEAGRVVGENGESAPLFHGSPIFSFGWFGGPSWYRNVRSASLYAFAMRLSDARSILDRLESVENGEIDMTVLCRLLSESGRRGLVNPFAKVYFDAAPETEWPNDAALYRNDPYFNPAFKEVSPLRLDA